MCGLHTLLLSSRNALSRTRHFRDEWREDACRQPIQPDGEMGQADERHNPLAPFFRSRLRQCRNIWQSHDLDSEAWRCGHIAAGGYNTAAPASRKGHMQVNSRLLHIARLPQTPSCSNPAIRLPSEITSKISELKSIMSDLVNIKVFYY